MYLFLESISEFLDRFSWVIAPSVIGGILTIYFLSGRISKPKLRIPKPKLKEGKIWPLSRKKRRTLIEAGKISLYITLFGIGGFFEFAGVVAISMKEVEAAIALLGMGTLILFISLSEFLS